MGLWEWRRELVASLVLHYDASCCGWKVDLHVPRLPGQPRRSRLALALAYAAPRSETMPTGCISIIIMRMSVMIFIVNVMILITRSIDHDQLTTNVRT